MRGYGMRSTVNTKNSRSILITGLVVFFILVMITPVSAELRTIKQGATVFIGEGNLDITNAVGGSNTIGWWASPATVTSTAPIKTINLAGRLTSFTVAPADFVGYPGNWYLLNLDGTTAQKATTGQPVAAFNVQDPALSLTVWDFNQNADVNGKWVMHGTPLGFQINTNMVAAIDSQYRPNVNAATDGYINIWFKGPSGVSSTSLYNSGGTPIPLTNQFVNSHPYYWGSSGNNWNTGALDQNGQYKYPSGTYTINAESRLNGMKDNYKNSGADYTGKTVSAAVTVTLLSDTVTIYGPDSVVRGEGHDIGIDIGAAPSSTYDLYINNGDVSGITPPTISSHATGIYGGAYGTYTFVSPGHYQVTTRGGLSKLFFETSSQTTPRVYTFKVVDPTGKQHEAQINVEVLPVPPASIGNIVVQSNPAGATIFLDNAIKGITPLTIQSVPNGAHIVLLRLKGYQDSSNSINVLGDNQTVNPTLTLITTGTTGATTIPTTASVTTTTTTGAIITELTTTVTTATPRPTATVNYSATIAAMQSQIAEQNVKITEQGNILEQITNFLRNVFGWK